MVRKRTHQVAGLVVLGCFLMQARVAAATPTPTSTPTNLLLHGSVERPGTLTSLIPAPDVTVNAYNCTDAALCLRGTRLEFLGSITTATDGSFTINILLRPPVFIVLDVGLAGGTLRTLVPSPFSGMGVTIDPISEAAVQLIDEQGLQRYDAAGIGEILTAVHTANAVTDFRNLELTAAVALAKSVAQADEQVERLLTMRMVTPTFTKSKTPTQVPTPTRTPSPSLTPTISPTPRATATAHPCIADCSGDDQVTVDELVTAVRILLGLAPLEDCIAADANGDGNVTVDEIIAAVEITLTICAPATADLVPSALRVVVPPGCAPLAHPPYVELCVANVGSAAAAPSRARAGDIVIDVGDVAAGLEVCLATTLAVQAATIAVEVDIDAANPGNPHDNDRASFDIAAPTPPPPCTPTATATRTPTPSPT